MDAGLTDTDKDSRKKEAMMKENLIKKMLDSWEAESESDDEEFVTRKPISRKTKKAMFNADGFNTFIMEGDDELDFLDNQAAQKVLTANPTKKYKRVSNKSVEDRMKEAGISFTGKGRLNIHEEADEGERKSQKERKAEAKKEVKPKMSLTQLKKMRGRKHMKKLAKKGHSITGLENYAPKKKSKGDAKRHQALEPFAYMRLNPKLTHEKNKIKAMASLGEVVKKANKTKGKKGTQIRKHSGKVRR